MSPSCVTQPSQEEEHPASSHAASQTHKARQSPTITGAVARLVGHPILNIIVQKLTPYNPGMTEQQIPPACQDDHPVMGNRPIKPDLSVPGAGGGWPVTETGQSLDDRQQRSGLEERPARVSQLDQIVFDNETRGGGVGWLVTDPDCPLDDRQQSSGLAARPVKDVQSDQTETETRGAGGGWPKTDPDCPLDDRQLSSGLEERPVHDDQGDQSEAEKRGAEGERRGADGQ